MTNSTTNRTSGTIGSHGGIGTGGASGGGVDLGRFKAKADWAKLPLFNRSKWQRVRFGDVVENLNETADPAEAGIERFIGLEHMEQDSLHIRNWGNVADGTTFTRRCRPGQVLFGKRRAYQRKVAVAEFDAVVSGDIYLFAPKNGRLLPGLLPFLCMSERFYQFAVETSAGSLSPRTNWSQLMQFEFALPPLDQQRRIAELLLAVDESIETASANLDLLSSLKQAAMEEYTLFGKPVESHGAEAPTYLVRRLGDVATTCQYGLSRPLSEGGRYPILRMMNYDEELVAATELKYADMPAEVAAVFKVQKGDILFNRTNSADSVGKAGIFDLDGCYLFASYLVRVQTDRSLLQPEFLNYHLNSRHGQIAVRAFATPGVSQSNISAGNLKKVEVPVPSIRDQETVVTKLKEIASAYRTARAHVPMQHAMILTFVNAIFGGQP